MDIVQNFMNSVAWYQPTTDTDDWQYFQDNCHGVDYTDGTSETLKLVAWNMLKMNPGLDVGMWQSWQQNFGYFLNGNVMIGDSDPVTALAIQYNFVACFRNNYSQASHNNDLWQSFNDQAIITLEQQWPSEISYQASAVPNIIISPGWLLTAIPAIIYTAFKTVEISLYRPTEDTDTWAYFQNVAFNFTALESVYITFNQTYLVNNISSSVDSGIWSTFSTACQAFLNTNFGTLPETSDSQIDLAINFCNLFQFDYSHAAHNNDLFKTYNDSFTNATVKLRALKPS